MKRRDFVHLTGLSAGIAWLPGVGSGVREWSGSLTPIPLEDRKALADAALGAAKSAGATYADVRIGRYLNQFINARDTKIQNTTNTESYGAGVRVIARAPLASAKQRLASLLNRTELSCHLAIGYPIN